MKTEIKFPLLASYNSQGPSILDSDFGFVAQGRDRVESSILYLVHAANNHAKLVDTVKRLMEIAQAHGSGYSTPALADERNKTIRSASGLLNELASARGEGER